MLVVVKITTSNRIGHTAKFAQQFFRLQNPFAYSYTSMSKQPYNSSTRATYSLRTSHLRNSL